MTDLMTGPTPEPVGSTPPPAPPAAPPTAPPSQPGSTEPRRDRARWERVGDIGSIVWGVVLLAVGGWFFVEHTLGYDLPAIDWNMAWPIALIVIGGWILVRSMSQRRS